MGLGGAVSLNMLDMIGVGPFITLPLVVAAMHGPQAILGWVAGAGLAICDGLVIAELGASMPKAGGSYEYLKQIYGPKRSGPPGVFSFYLAVDVQRAAFDCLRLHRAFRLRRISLAQPAHRRRAAQFARGASAAGPARSQSS